MDFEKPLPIPTPTTAPFWEGLNAGIVRIQRCTSCNAWVFYPRHRCPHCLSDALSWQDVSGRGTLYTFTIARQPTSPHFAGEVPQLLAVVELDEGVRLTTTLVDIAPEAIEVGMKVKPYFDRVADDVTLLRYRPA
jgi:uncharacterized OB-fold protein